MSELTKIRSDYENNIRNARIDQNTSKLSDKTEDSWKINWAQNRIMITQSSKKLQISSEILCGISDIRLHQCRMCTSKAHMVLHKNTSSQFTRARIRTVCLIIIALDFRAFEEIVGGHKGHVIFNNLLIFFPHLPFFRKKSLSRGRPFVENLALCNVPLPIFPQLR